MSDLEAVKEVPVILGSLKNHALNSLLFLLMGRQPSSDSRHVREGEIKKALAKLQRWSGQGGLSDVSVKKIALVLRNRRSYMHYFQSANTLCKVVMATSSVLAAAHKAFDCLRKFPTCFVVEVNKLLIMKCNTESPLSLNYETHSSLAEVVIIEAEKIMLPLKEGDTLPGHLEGALHAISLSARLLVGSDGGLSGLMRPLPSEILGLETKFRLAYDEINRLDNTQLQEVCVILGGRAALPTSKKNKRINKLRQILINSMHCIYTHNDFPEDIKEVIEMINSTSGKRVDAETNALLNVSAAFQSVVWEFYDTFYTHELGMRGERMHLASRNDSEKSCLKGHHVKVENTQLVSNFIHDLERQNVESDKHMSRTKMETPDRLHKAVAVDVMTSQSFHQEIEEFFQNVQSFCDEAAMVVFVLIGHLLKDISMQCIPMDQRKVDYLQSELEKVRDSNACTGDSQKMESRSGCSENLIANQKIINIAKQLKTIPRRVLSDVERRMQGARAVTELFPQKILNPKSKKNTSIRDGGSTTSKNLFYKWTLPSCSSDV